jgi:hypothetical protein
MSFLRKFFYEVFYNPINLFGKFINACIALLIIFSIALLPFYFLPGIKTEIQDELLIFEKIILVIFTGEYLLRLWSSPSPIRYFFSFFGIIDLLSVLPFWLELLNLFDFGKLFLLLRIIRLFKLGGIYNTEREAMNKNIQEKHGKFTPLPGETIERIVQKHPIIFVSSLITPLVFISMGFGVLIYLPMNMIVLGFSSFFFIFSLVFFIKVWLDFHYDLIYITNIRLVMQNREIFGSSINDISYPSITNIRPDNTGFFNFIFRTGTLTIETAASMTENTIFDHIPAPEEVVHHISRNRKLAIERNIRGSVDRNEGDL